MLGKLTRFKIVNLHGLRTIDVRINENRLILVGENGTGKSTVAYIIYYFLTKQWGRLSDFQFDEILADINGVTYPLDGKLFGRISKIFENRYNTRTYLTGRQLSLFDSEVDEGDWFSEILESITQQRATELSSAEIRKLESLSRRHGVPARHLLDIIGSDDSESIAKTMKQLEEIEGVLKDVFSSQVLFLPTYRRIEQDLETIFQGRKATRAIEEFTQLWKQSRKPSRKAGGFVELIEFGMSDVDTTINEKMSMLDGDRRVGLDKLTGSYLRDVINRQYRTVHVKEIVKTLDDDTVEAVLGRIPKDVLTQGEKAALRESIGRLKDSQSEQVEDLVAILYLVRLFELHETQQNEEREVRLFVEVCNAYLSGKKLHYDDLNFKMSLVQENNDINESGLEMGMLSSGEKQIVSLFSHIFLSGVNEFFVIIDEPELSLSVPWQKRFLVDILGSERCTGLVAVTHSPFIYENDLISFTHSIEEFLV